MGRRNKSYTKSLHQQAYDKLTKMLKAGEGTSKKNATDTGTDKDKIFSYATYQTYWQHTKYFVRWVSQKHPECSTLSKARNYVNEWLTERTSQIRNGKQLSPWTIHTEEAALNKLYGIARDDPNRFQAPARNRHNISRSRSEVKQDKHFSKANNAELINFCRGTGCRRNILTKLTKEDLWTRAQMEKSLFKLQNQTPESRNITLTKALQDALQVFPDQDTFLYHRKDKGGKYRFAPVIGEHKPDIIRRFQETMPGKKVWEYVHSAADVHGYRGDYAMTIYKYYARNIDDIPYDKTSRGTGQKYQSLVYVCRRDEAGKRLDKAAMLKASKALGHNRLSVVAVNYLRGI